MYTLCFILGVIVGILWSALTLFLVFWKKPAIDRVVNQVASKLKEKGEILEPENEEVEEWIEGLKSETDEK